MLVSQIRPSRVLAMKKRGVTTLSHLQERHCDAVSDNKGQSSSLFKKFAVVGGGNMAEAILSALKGSEKQNMENILVAEKSQSRLDYLQKKYGVRCTTDVKEAVKGAEITMLCVKPQNIEDVAEEIREGGNELPGILLSIVAGYPIATLQELFGNKSVIRTMPNTPASVMQGMTVWHATKGCDPEVVKKAQVVLECIGQTAQVTEERYLDMATAVSGSGPAYVFLVMESMIEAAVHVGFPRKMATQLVVQTIKGSAIFAENAELPVETLRHNVTSPGGTTASALYALERGGFRTVVADAIWAAYRRSLELGDKNSNVGPGRAHLHIPSARDSE